MAVKRFSVQYSIILLCVIVSLTGLGVKKAVAMGFHVQPSKISFEILPGKTAVFRIQVDNLKLDQESTMAVEIFDFKQGNNGSISLSEEQGGEKSPSPEHSCRSWIQLAESSFSVLPLSGHELEIRVNIPSNATGDYYGLLAIESMPKKAEGDFSVSMAVRFLVPIEISVTGRTPRKRVEISDSALMAIPAVKGVPAKETVIVTLKNSGEVSAKLDGEVTISEILAGRVRRVASLPIKQIKIIPGSEFDLLLDSPRRLPSGTYKITAEIMADERRLPTLARSVDFIGDPKITSVNADAMVTMEPSILEVVGAPKSKRKSYAFVKNAGTETVAINIDIEPVETLGAVAMGGVLGSDLDCSSWITITPKTFELAPGSAKRVAVNCTFPLGDQLMPGSYAHLVMIAKFKDNQLAAEMTGLVVARNAKADAKKMLTVSKSSLSRGENEDYVFSVEYINTGEIDLEVNWTMNLKDLARSRSLFKNSLPVEDRPILPMETRRSHCIISSSKFEPGDYILVVKATFGSEDLVKEFPVRVSDQNGQKHLEIVR